MAEKRKEEEFKSNEAEAKRKEEIIRIYGNTIGTRLLNSEIWIGMTDDMAKISLGSPSKNNRTVMASKISEQWVYYNKYLYFDNGILTAFA